MSRRERGSALIIVMLVILALVGVGLMALRQTRTEMSTTGNIRVSKQALEAAYSGLTRATLITMAAPDYFHRLAVRSNNRAPRYDPLTVYTLRDPFADDTKAADTRDDLRIGNLQFTFVMSRPRLAPGPPGFQVAGGTGNRFVFYTYQFDVYGWVRPDGDTSEDRNVTPGTGGARKLLRADVRLGPIAVNQ